MESIFLEDREPYLAASMPSTVSTWIILLVVVVLGQTPRVFITPRKFPPLTSSLRVPEPADETIARLTPGTP